jgi:hypothetical protein
MALAAQAGNNNTVVQDSTAHRVMTHQRHVSQSDQFE